VKRLGHTELSRQPYYRSKRIYRNFACWLDMVTARISYRFGGYGAPTAAELLISSTN
jgi:hypothetical protein